MKDNTGEVHAQVPVDVATFLLNEKRAELFGMEERLDVSVFLIPNIHLENPHYDISRVRTDDVDDNAEPSYKRVAAPEEDETAKPFGGEKAKTARPEPAVKGVKHTQPAPTVAENPASASWWSSFTSWLGKVFGGGKREPDKTPEAEKPEKRQANRTNGRRPSNRRQNPRRTPDLKRADNNGAQTDAPAAAERQDGNKESANRETRSNRRSQGDNRERSRQTDNEAKAAATENGSRAARQEARRNRADKAAEKAAAATVAALPETAVGITDTPAAPAAESSHSDKTAGKNGKDSRSPRQERSRSRDQQHERRNGSKKRNIPSAAKIEQYLSIGEAADKVRFAVAHVFGEAEEVPLAVAVAAPLAKENQTVDTDRPLVVVIPEIDDTYTAETPALFAIEADTAPAAALPDMAATPAHDAADGQNIIATASANVEEAVSQIIGTTAFTEETLLTEAFSAAQKPDESEKPVETAAETFSDGLDLGGLVLVHTRTDALAAASAWQQPETASGLRRSDVPKAEEVPGNDVPLVQVETRQ